MIVGHYGVSFALKSVCREVPLWVLFVAVQFLDFLWLSFVSMHVEQSWIDRHLLSVPLDLHYIPYSHSLLAALIWTGLAVAACKAIPLGRHNRAAWIVGAAVLSHWIADLLVHRPDLALYDSAYKVGLAGWNYPVFAYVLEGACLFAGIVLYQRATTPRTNAGRYAPFAYGIGLMALQAPVVFGLVDPPSIAFILIGLLIFYLAASALAHAVERTRE